MTEELEAQQLWDQMCKGLHEGDLNPPLWEAVDAVSAVVVDGDTLIVGIEPARMQHASYIETTRNKAIVQDALEQASGRRLDVRVISGRTAADWERVKAREAASVETATAQMRVTTAQRGARDLWREGAEEVFEIFTGTRARARGTDLARLMLEAVAAMYEVEQTARKETSGDEELHSQQLNRIIDRVATYCSVPPPIVALEYLRYCREEH